MAFFFLFGRLLTSQAPPNLVHSLLAFVLGHQLAMYEIDLLELHGRPLTLIP